MSVKTVKVSNLSLKASPRDVREFFSFSGDIVYVEVQSNDDHSQNAFVTFTDSQGAETAVLLSGATIADLTVTVTLAPDYQLPLEATSAPRGGPTSEDESVIRKAEDVVSSMFAKAKSFDEKIGFTERVTIGTSMVNEKVKELHVSEKAKSAYAAAEQTVSNAGSALSSWVSGAFTKVAKAASEVGQKDKVVDDVAPAQHQSPSKSWPQGDEQKVMAVDDVAPSQQRSPKRGPRDDEKKDKVVDDVAQSPSKSSGVQGLVL